jgi:spore maturation protein SpmA/spore maturation protein SpmB
MALTRIWSAFVIIAFVVASFKYFSGNGETQIFSTMVIGKSGDSVRVKEMNLSTADPALLKGLDTSARIKQGKMIYKKEGEKIIAVKVQNASGIIQTCKDAVEICIGLIGILALFMGFMTIAERAGGVNLLSRIIGPFFTKLFPEIPKGHPSMGHMMMNFSANLLGLDNAATPFGIKTMESLQELNPDKTRATNSQIMFLTLHAAGFNLIPVSVIAIRASAGAKNATDIFIPCMIVTFCGTVAAMIIVSIRQRINLLQPVILAWLLSVSVVIAGFVYLLSGMDKTTLENFSGTLGNGLLLLILAAIVLGGLYKRINIFDAFIEGAKGGFEVAIRIIPYLVGMLVAISLLRTSGTFDYVIDAIRQFFAAVGADTRFVEGLPTALVRPFSGSGARGMMVDTMNTYGADSFAGRLSSILQGCADTTFYVVAVYFGSVGIKNTRYSIGSMLLADLVAIITAIFLCYLFFGSSV